MDQLVLDEALQAEHAAAVERTQKRRVDLETVQQRLDELPGLLLDMSDNEARKTLRRELIDLVDARLVLLVELRELEGRERCARRAVYAEAEDRARRAYEQAAAKSKTLHRKAGEVELELRAALNSAPEDLRGDLDAIELYRADLRGKREKAWALSRNAKRAVDLAEKVWQAAGEQLHQVDEELGKIILFPGSAGV